MNAAWWLQFKTLPWDRRVLVGAALVALLPALYSAVQTPAPPPARSAAAVDTHIPRGFVLIPIEVQNYEALDSILGRFGVVDLYQSGSPESPQRLVARNVRILRAPQNPSHFAVLIPESESASVLRHGGPFTVTIKQPAGSGTEFVKQQAVPKRSITYEGG